MSMWDYSYPFQYFYTDCPPVKIRQTHKPIDWTKPVREKSPQHWMGAGTTYRSVRLLGKLKGTNLNVLAFEEGPNCEVIEQWTDSAILEKLENTPPKKIVQYVNAYPSGGYGGTYPTRYEADSGAGSDRIACVRVEIEEGRFDG
jgi:hypothetical protein